MSTRPITVSIHELTAILSRIRGSTALAFTALTTPEGRKAPWPIRKLTRINAMTGCRYAHAAAKAGETAAEERHWGEHNVSALVTKPGREGQDDVHYLPVQINHASRPLYLVPGVNGRLTAVPAERVQPYLRPERARVVDYRDYALSSLISVSLGGQRYRVRQSAAQQGAQRAAT